MRKIIHNLRQQPERIRRSVIHVAVFVFAILMVSLWVWSLGGRFSGEETQAGLKESLEPFSALKDSLSNIEQGTGNVIYSLKDENKNKQE